MSNEDKKEQLTYLIRDTAKNLYKIGKSIDPDKRLKQMSTSNIHLELVATSKVIDEKYLHSVLTDKRLYLPTGKKSEWFLLEDQDLEDVLRIMLEGDPKLKRIHYTDEELRERIDKLFAGYPLERDEENQFYDKMHGRFHWCKRVKKLQNYKIKGGKYKGRRLTSMQSPDEIDYLQWFCREFRKKPKPKWMVATGGKWDWASQVYSKYCWWLGVIYKNNDLLLEPITSKLLEPIDN